jgi:uncharacterized membrane protein YfcA
MVLTFVHFKKAFTIANLRGPVAIATLQQQRLYMQLELIYVVCGLLVGFIVGLTGVGGGSLMTPILLHFGIPPTSAVGTDLLYAAITKSGGVFVHGRKRNVDWRITGELALGSLPAALLTLWIMHSADFNPEAVNRFIKIMLGYALVFTSLAIIFKQKLLDYSHRNDVWITRMSRRQQALMTIGTGVVLGAVVTITSIGAGALGTVALFLLYPLLPDRHRDRPRRAANPGRGTRPCHRRQCRLAAADEPAGRLVARHLRGQPPRAPGIGQISAARPRDDVAIRRCKTDLLNGAALSTSYSRLFAVSQRGRNGYWSGGFQLFKKNSHMKPSVFFKELKTRDAQRVALGHRVWRKTPLRTCVPDDPMQRGIHHGPVPLLKNRRFHVAAFLKEVPASAPEAHSPYLQPISTTPRAPMLDSGHAWAGVSQ